MWFAVFCQTLSGFASAFVVLTRMTRRDRYWPQLAKLFYRLHVVTDFENQLRFQFYFQSVWETRDLSAIYIVCSNKLYTVLLFHEIEPKRGIV